MGKRRRGFGAIYHRPDGRWRARFVFREGARRSFYARTRRDVIHRLSQERWGLGQGLPVSAGTTSGKASLDAYTVDVQRFLPFVGRVAARA